MTPDDSSRLLRLALRGNATFSTLSGATFLAASGPIAELLGDAVRPGDVLGVGAQLLAFAVALIWLSTRPVIARGLAIAVVVADLLWVLGSAVALFADVLTRPGALAVLVVANIVLVFAVLQGLGIRRMHTPLAARA